MIELSLCEGLEGLRGTEDTWRTGYIWLRVVGAHLDRWTIRCSLWSRSARAIRTSPSFSWGFFRFVGSHGRRESVGALTLTLAIQRKPATFFKGMIVANIPLLYTTELPSSFEYPFL